MDSNEYAYGDSIEHPGADIDRIADKYRDFESNLGAACWWCVGYVQPRQWSDREGLERRNVTLPHQLDVRGVGAILWKAQSFGKDQEVFVTLAKVDPFGREINLLLKAQSPTNWGDGVIEVSYNAIDDHVQILTYTFAQDWKQCGANIPVTFVDGDKFGAKAKADGTVEVYRNGSLIGSCNVSASYPHFANGGYIGLWFLDASNSVADDFGGGTITP